MSSNRLPVLAEVVRNAHTGVQDAAKTAAERTIEAGHALLEAKDLVKHGQWLPWLKKHCQLPERTAQLYMKIAKLGLESATVAEIGLNAAAKAITIQFTDPFADDTEEVLDEWRLYGLFLMTLGVPNEYAGLRCEWLRRNGWCSPSEWYTKDGDLYRKRVGFKPMPDSAKAEWHSFLAENKTRSAEYIKEEVRRLTEAERSLPKTARKRRRRAA